MTDFIKTYVPNTLDLPKEDILDCRLRIESFIHDYAPQQATQPNTVFGDLVVTPQAYLMAALEKGADHLLSDLNLENVSNEIVYNCDFVEAYLKNFIPADLMSAPSSGTIRLVFTEDKEYVLDRSTKFQINSAVFSIYLPHLGPFTIVRVGQVLEDGVNGTQLKDSGSNVFFADVPVVGHSGVVSVKATEAALISRDIPELGAASALHNFNSGSTALTVSQAAKLTRQTIHAASMNTRHGAIQFVRSVCPFVESVYATCNHDREMLRDMRNPFGVSSGVVDIMARSKSYAFMEQQQVKVVLEPISQELIDFLELEAPADVTGFEFYGEFHYVGQPYYIESVTHPNINSKNLEHLVVSQTPPELGVAGCYSGKERLFLRVKNLVDEVGDSLFPIEVDSDGKRYIYVTVTYHTDPMMPALASTIMDPDHRPVNTDILVRGFTPVVIERFEVVYVQNPGVVPLLSEARTRIGQYLDKVGAPDTFSEAVISQIMQEAGVKYVKDIRVQAYVQWSLGDVVTNYNGDAVPTSSEPVISDSKSLRVTYPAPDVDIEAADMYACSPRTIRYHLMENSISFTEIKEM